jgi:two-component system cell cycle sensor histidine kinase/response regulator CckA
VKTSSGPTRSHFRATLLLSTVLATVIVFAIGYMFQASRRADAEEIARIQSRNLAQALDQNISSTFQRIDLALGSVVGELADNWEGGNVNRARMERYLVMEGKLIPWPGIIWIANAQGRAIVGNRPIEVVPPWEGRWWFQYCKAHPEAGLVISKPIIGFLTKKWVISCVRRFNRPNGDFGGVVVIPLSVDYLQSLLSGYELGVGGTFVLRDTDGGYIARYPRSLNRQEPAIGDFLGSQDFVAFIQSGAEDGSYISNSTYDQVPRMYASRRIKIAPMIVTAGLSQADYLARWRRDRTRVVLIFGFSILCIWAIYWFFLQSWINHERNADALFLSEERFRLAMDATSDGIWDWNIQTGEGFFSASYTKMLGFNPEEFPARAESWVELIVLEDRERVLAINQECIQGIRPSFEVEYRMQARDGTLKWILGRGKAINRDSQGRALRMVGTHTDLTERKLTEVALLEAAEFNQKLLAASSLGLQAFHATSGQCMLATEGAACMIGGSKEQLLAQNFRTIDSWKSTGILDAAEITVATGIDQRFEISLRSTFQKPMFASCHFTTFHARGETHLLLIMFDIADRKLAEEENLRLQAQLQQAQKMESLGTLAGGIAHDMNNVLGAILGLASSNLETQPSESPAYRSFETIAKAATRGGEMVRNLLSFARQGQAEERLLDLNAILLEEVKLLERTVLSNVHLELDLESGLYPMLGDSSTLTSAFMNLCVNAVDAMPVKGCLTLRTRNVDRDWIEVVIEDTGTGMPKEVLEKAMEPFFTTKEVGKGTGLGLSMVYSTVKAHRGQIEIQSHPGLGTKVRMRLPACEPPSKETELDPGILTEAPSRSLNVLLVDDDELIQSAMEAVLQTLGHAVSTSRSGEEALAKIEAGFVPDVVILDMNMPGLGGIGTLPHLREILPTVPVLLSTGRTDQAALDLSRAYPFVTLLPKPFSIKEIQRCLGSLK